MLIPPKVFQIGRIASKEAARYALTGVYFERDSEGKPWAVASDGRRLFAVTWEEWNRDEYPAGVFDTAPVNGFKVILPPEDAKEAPKLNGKAAKSSLPALQFVGLEEPTANGTVKLAGTDLERKRTVEPRVIEGSFPDWRAVFPRYAPEDAVTVVLDPVYLAELCELAQAVAGQDRARSIRLTVPKERSRPILLEAKDPEGTRAKAVLMPLDLDPVDDPPAPPCGGVVEAAPVEAPPAEGGEA